MIKKILVSACLLLSVLGFAQEGSYSPYSFYGVGDQRFKGTVDSRSMGGLTIFADSIHLNLQNPASLSALKLTTLSVGATTSVINLDTETQQEQAKRTAFDYFAVGLPITSKLGVSFGLMPYSSVGYKILSRRTLAPDGEEQILRAQGSGDINRVFLAAGYAITKNFRLGFGADYNFGKIETSSQLRTDLVQYGTEEASSSEIKGFSANAGLIYEGKINKKLKAFGAITYTSQGNLTSNNFRTVSIVQVLSGGTAVVDIDTLTVSNTKLRLPSKLSFGGGIGQDRKWQVGAEITLQQSKDQLNRIDEQLNVSFENGIRYTLGGYYIPNYNSFSSYVSRITYRAGVRYENTGLVISDQSIHDTGVTLGFGFPITGTFSNLNVGLEYGKRGTVSYGLVEENYFNLSIGFSFNDKWFQRRKYD